jgi:hypothetical protein
MESTTTDTASLKTATTYDAAALKRMTQAIAQQTGTMSAAEIAALPAMQMTHEGKYLFDRSIGVMREMTVSRRVVASGASRFDGWEIRLVGSSKR